MKKKQYFNKYHYIDFYTKSPGLWFFSNNEIKAAITNTLCKKSNIEEKEVNLEVEYDAYKQTKIELNANDNNEILLLIGQKIDYESRLFLIQKYQKQVELVYDIDEKQKYQNNEKKAQITQQLLKENKKILLFQPVFIFQKLITKCDAILKDQSKINIIETKATTTAKLHHYLDLFFQKKVIEQQSFLSDFYFDYYLCLLQYTMLSKNQTLFELTPYLNLKKQISFKTGLNAKIKNQLKKGYVKEKDYLPYKIKDLMNDNFNALKNNLEIGKNANSKKALNKIYVLLQKTNQEFNTVISQLNYHQIHNLTPSPVFYPHPNNKSPFKESHFWAEIKTIYVLQGFNVFAFSGHVSDIKAEQFHKLNKHMPLNTFLKKPKNNPSFYLTIFNNKITKYEIKKELVTNYLNKIKSCTIYFDFETINLPFGILDGSYPFEQIVYQCSIIKIIDNDLTTIQVNNLICDPKKIDPTWFQKVIDNLYTMQKNVTYFVYNQAFEIQCLKIMQRFLNAIYEKKIKNIIDHIFDLAIFFKISSQNGYLICFSELKGFYSIKKILPLIQKYAPKIFQKTKCLNYNSLKIQDGYSCQTKAIKRFLALTNDQKWIKNKNNMIIYCENDVRAMIAIKYFVKELVDGTVNI